LLKVACTGPGVSRTCNLSVTSPILYNDTTAPTRYHFGLGLGLVLGVMVRLRVRVRIRIRVRVGLGLVL